MAARHDSTSSSAALEAGQWQEVKPDWWRTAAHAQQYKGGLLENGHWGNEQALTEVREDGGDFDDDDDDDDENEDGQIRKFRPAWKPARKARRRWLPFRLDNIVAIPRFLSRATTRAPRLRRTAYLDGLRGFAALLVYWGHHELWAHDPATAELIMENAFGFEQRFYFVCLPGVRTFFTGGHFAVSVFFVLSGYVLAMKPLSLLHDGDYVRFGDNVASALFRRWLRLYIPVIATTFLYMSSFHALGVRGATPDPERTYRDELWKWYAELKNFSFIFNTGGEPWFSYNFHSWSIPVEFKGSIVVYTALLAFSRASRNARLACQVGLIVYFLYIADGWFGAMFVGGMLLCDLELLAAHHNLPSSLSRLAPSSSSSAAAPSSPSPSTSSGAEDTGMVSITTILFCISIYLGGVPAASREVQTLRDSPGWYYLSFLKPQAVFDFKRFYLFWAAMLLVGCLPHMPRLRGFFEMRANQYLGRVSYALYLVHGPVLWTLGDRVYAAVGWTRPSHATNCPGWVNRLPLPMAGPMGLEVAFLVPQLVLLPVTLWAAEIVTRLVDERAVQVAHWAYSKTLSPSSKS